MRVVFNIPPAGGVNVARKIRNNILRIAASFEIMTRVVVIEIKPNIEKFAAVVEKC